MVFSDGIRSQLEWNSTLSTVSAPLPTEETKYLRKVSDHTQAVDSGTESVVDGHHRNHRCVVLSQICSELISNRSL